MLRRLVLTGSLALGFVYATTQPAFAAPNCGRDIANLGALKDAPMILLGELHGLEGVPAFAIGLACRLGASGKPVVLALEIPRQEQERIDAFLASKGGATSEAALLTGAFWRREFQDGRSSLARLAMLDHCHRTNPRPCTQPDLEELLDRAW